MPSTRVHVIHHGGFWRLIRPACEIVSVTLIQLWLNLLSADYLSALYKLGLNLTCDRIVNIDILGPLVTLTTRCHWKWGGVLRCILRVWMVHGIVTWSSQSFVGGLALDQLTMVIQRWFGWVFKLLGIPDRELLTRLLGMQLVDLTVDLIVLTAYITLHDVIVQLRIKGTNLL